MDWWSANMTWWLCDSGYELEQSGIVEYVLYFSFLAAIPLTSVFLSRYLIERSTPKGLLFMHTATKSFLFFVGLPFALIANVIFLVTESSESVAERLWLIFLGIPGITLLAFIMWGVYLNIVLNCVLMKYCKEGEVIGDRKIRDKVRKMARVWFLVHGFLCLLRRKHMNDILDSVCPRDT